MSMHLYSRCLEYPKLVTILLCSTFTSNLFLDTLHLNLMCAARLSRNYGIDVGHVLCFGDSESVRYHPVFTTGIIKNQLYRQARDIIAVVSLLPVYCSLSGILILHYM